MKNTDTDIARSAQEHQEAPREISSNHRLNNNFGMYRVYAQELGLIAEVGLGEDEQPAVVIQTLASSLRERMALLSTISECLQPCSVKMAEAGDHASDMQVVDTAGKVLLELVYDEDRWS